MRHLFTLLLLFAIIPAKLFAQDPQFTQFYATPIYLNPAYTGSNGNIRAAMNYRNQWPGSDAQSITYMASYDQHFPYFRSSFGLLAKRDEQYNGLGSTFSSTEVALSYAYKIEASESFSIQPAIQVGYALRDVDFNSFIFGDQITNNGIGTNPTAERFPNEQVGYVDVSTGFLVFSDRMWFGVAVHHLNEPNQSVLGGIDVLPLKTTAHFGLVIPTKRTRRRLPDLQDGTIIPVIQYQAQGRSDQLSLGVYGNFDPIVAGFWYRGLPVKRFDNSVSNNDALAVLLGLYVKQMTVAYSYDFTVSELAPVTNGAHEISLTFDFKPKDDRKQPRRGYRGKRRRGPSPWKRIY